MKVSKAAKRYVKAVFELARQQNQLDRLARDMQAAQQIFETHPELIDFLRRPTVAASAKSQTLRKIFSGDFSPLFRQLLDLLARRKRLELLPDIAYLFNEHYKKAQGIVEARVTLAVPVTDELRNQFLEKVKQITGKDRIELQMETDPDIIGGYILQIGDLRIDDSVRGKIRKIKQKIIQ